MNTQHTPAPVSPEHRSTPPAIPLWNAGNDNQDPYQEPGFLIRNGIGV